MCDTPTCSLVFCGKCVVGIEEKLLAGEKAGVSRETVIVKCPACSGKKEQYEVSGHPFSAYRSNSG